MVMMDDNSVKMASRRGSEIWIAETVDILLFSLSHLYTLATVLPCLAFLILRLNLTFTGIKWWQNIPIIFHFAYIRDLWDGRQQAVNKWCSVATLYVQCFTNSLSFSYIVYIDGLLYSSKWISTLFVALDTSFPFTRLQCVHLYLFSPFTLP